MSDLTVGQLKELLEFVDDNTRVLFLDSEYGYETAEEARLDFVTGSTYIHLADPDDSIETEIALVIW